MSFRLKHWWNLILFFCIFFVQIAKTTKTSYCFSETYFLLKKFSARYEKYIKYFRKDTKSFRSSLTLLDFLILLQNILNGIVEKRTVKDKTDISKMHLSVN